jgi:hypothetical protein
LQAARELIRRAKEKGGVEFIDENGGGPGVRLRKRAPEEELGAAAGQLVAPVSPVDHRYIDLAGCRSIANDKNDPNSMEGTVNFIKKSTCERLNRFLATPFVPISPIVKWDRIANTGGRKNRPPNIRGKRVEKPEYRWRQTALLEPD